MSDRILRQNVIDELDFDPSIDAASIGVAVDNGIVTLSGHVASYAERRTAEKAAQKVRGVRGVIEEIKVRFPGEALPRDEEIAHQAVQVLDWNTRVPKNAVQVKVQDGLVTLSGDLSWQYQKEEAESSLRRLHGIKGLMNIIAVKPVASAANVRSKIEAALKRNAKVEADQIQVSVKGDTVTLDGSVHAWHERNLAEIAAWSAPGVRSVVDHLTLA